MSPPCLLFVEVFPNKAPFSWGAHSFRMVTEHFALAVIAAFHSQRLPEMRGSKKAHTYTSKVATRKANCSNYLAARNLAKVCLMPELFANSQPGSHTPVASPLGWAQI